MWAAIIGYGFIILSVCLQLYYWYTWTNIESNKKISAICRVIICRTFAVIAFIIALITLNSNIYLYITFAISFMLVIYDVLRLKWQIDKKIK